MATSYKPKKPISAKKAMSILNKNEIPEDEKYIRAAAAVVYDGLKQAVETSGKDSTEARRQLNYYTSQILPFSKNSRTATYIDSINSKIQGLGVENTEINLARQNYMDKLNKRKFE